MTLAERQAQENIRELQEIARTKGDDIRHLKYRTDDLAIAILHIVKRISLQPLTVEQNEQFIKAMTRIQKDLERK